MVFQNWTETNPNLQFFSNRTEVEKSIPHISNDRHIYMLGGL